MAFDTIRYRISKFFEKIEFQFFKLKPYFIRPFNKGFLPERDGHQIFYQEFGNPVGEVVLLFHGGPGGSSKPKHAAAWNLKKYRVILFDQRGCGKTISSDVLYKNTLQETLEDALAVLEEVNIHQKVIVSGRSYGTTCALAFTQAYPQKVKKLILNSVFLARRQDYYHLSPASDLFYPDVIHLFKKYAREEELESYYYDLLFSDERGKQLVSLSLYGAFEHQLGARKVIFKPPVFSEKALNDFKIYMHYMKHGFFLEEDQLIRDAEKIRSVPVWIFQNRLDFTCPPSQAFALNKALKTVKFYLLAQEGHCAWNIDFKIYKTFS